MEKEFYTVKEIGEALDMPESTVRYFRDRFIDFVPYVGKGRSRKYTKESIEVIQAIVEYNNAKMNAEEIERHLSSRFPRVIDVTQKRKKQNVAERKEATNAENEVAVASEPGFQVTSAEMMLAIQQVQENLIGLSKTIHMMLEQQKELEELKSKLSNQEERENELLARIEKLEETQKQKKPRWKFW